MVVETLTEFYSRIYTNFGAWNKLGKVFVWPSKYQKEKDKSKPQVWTIQTAKNYIAWLESKQPMRMGI